MGLSYTLFPTVSIGLIEKFMFCRKHTAERLNEQLKISGITHGFHGLERLISFLYTIGLPRKQIGQLPLLPHKQFRFFTPHLLKNYPCSPTALHRFFLCFPSANTPLPYIAELQRNHCTFATLFARRGHIIAPESSFLC